MRKEKDGNLKWLLQEAGEDTGWLRRRWRRGTDSCSGKGRRSWRRRGRKGRRRRWQDIVRQTVRGKDKVSPTPPKQWSCPPWWNVLQEWLLSHLLLHLHILVHHLQHLQLQLVLGTLVFLGRGGKV